MKKRDGSLRMENQGCLLEGKKRKHLLSCRDLAIEVEMDSTAILKKVKRRALGHLVLLLLLKELVFLFLPKDLTL